METDISIKRKNERQQSQTKQTNLLKKTHTYEHALATMLRVQKITQSFIGISTCCVFRLFCVHLILAIRFD